MLFSNPSLLGGNSPIPKYYHFAAVICENYRKLPVGATLPPLTELAKNFAVSKETINRSMRFLASKGFVKSERGRGTVILKDLGLALGISPVGGAREEVGRTFAMVLRRRSLPAPDVNLAEIEIVAGAQHRLQEENLNLVTLVIGDNPEHSLNRHLREPSRFSGFLFMVDMLQESDAELIRGLEVCAVVVNEDRWASHTMCVTANEESGMRSGVRHLHTLGHRRFCCVLSSPEERRWPRVLGIEQGVEEVGGTLSFFGNDSGRIGAGAIESWAESSTPKMLEAHSKDTAFICPSPKAAVGLCRGLKANGIKPGGNHSVLCFGYPEHEWNAIDEDDMRITNVAKPRYAMGRAAADVLLQQSEAVYRQVGIVRIPCPLMIGNTTSAPA